ncbi:MAG TPA: EamA family transporter [Acidimicrobiia bacterium]|nr:EamA family transporter [Acidimicrobiia bacterium]
MYEKPTVPDRLTTTAFTIAVIIGGMNFVAVRFSNRELPPLFGAGARFAIAAVLLLVVMRLRRSAFPRGRALVGTVIYGVLSFTAVYALLYWALQSLSAGVAAVLLASTPLLTLFVVAIHGLEPFRLRGLVGSVIVIGGIAVLANAPSDARIELLPMLAVLGGALGAGYSGVVLKMFPPADPVATNATAMGVGSVLLLALSAAVGESWVVPQDASTWLALVYLIVIGSLLLFGLFLFTLARWTASAVAYMPALMPISAMVFGALIADERITVAGVGGGAIVLVGVWVGALSRPRRRVND